MIVSQTKLLAEWRIVAVANDGIFLGVVFFGANPGKQEFCHFFGSVSWNTMVDNG